MTKRDAYLIRRYGITERQYNELIRDQGGRCPICLRAFRDIAGRPHVDHSHKTGEIRGILCAYDNHRVVGRHTDSDKLRRVADYLDQGTGLFIPDRGKRKKRKRKGKR